MKKLPVRFGFVLGFLMTAPLIAVMYLADQLLNLSFVPYDLFDWVARVLPGPVVTFGIDTMINTLHFLGINVAQAAKTAERTIAILQFLGMGVIVGMIFIFVINRLKTQPSPQAGIFLGLVVGLPLIGISIAISNSPINPLLNILWLLVLFLGWGILFSRVAATHLKRLTSRAAQEGEKARVDKLSRREFLVTVGGASAAITVVGTGLGVLADSLQKTTSDSMAHNAETSVGLPFPNSNDPVMPAPGTRPEYTPIKDHYQVFLKTEPSVIPADGYMLPITGMVDNPLVLTLDDIRNNYPVREQYVTLSCISGRVGTSLISTTHWTGASMQAILEDAGVQEGAKNLYITSEDGFYEVVPLELIASDDRIMLCYDWDGNTLPVGHGFPLRIWIPDRYGMKQPKWITSIEVTDRTDLQGYWVERNWDEIAQVKATSVIDTVAVNSIITDGDQRLIPIGGIAFSGERGISQVQVRVDGGTWQDAQLRAPLSETTWVIWRYDWLFEAGDHTFEVRCAESDGTPQIEIEQASRPSGATGIHQVEETIS